VVACSFRRCQPTARPISGLSDATQGYADIILKVNGVATGSRAELRRVLAGVKKGEIVTAHGADHHRGWMAAAGRATTRKLNWGLGAGENRFPSPKSLP